MKRPWLILSLAGLTAIFIVASFLIIVLSVNPDVGRNETAINRAVDDQHAIICAQVQNVANAYRFRSLTPSGKVEPVPHFLTRMQAQRETLRLAQGLNCKSAPGFLPVGLQVKRALKQISRILMSFQAKKRKPVVQEISPAPEPMLPAVILQEETPYLPQIAIEPSKALEGSRDTQPLPKGSEPRRAPPTSPEGVSEAVPVSQSPLQPVKATICSVADHVANLC